MPGLTRQCRAGESFQVGSATIRIVKTGRRATVNIVAPPDVLIEHVGWKKTDAARPAAAHLVKSHELQPTRC